MKLVNQSAPRQSGVPPAGGRREADSVGYLVIEAGGVAAKGDLHFAKRCDDFPLQSPVVRIHVDTDLSETSRADKSVFIGMRSEQMNELCANAARFGPEIVAAVRHLGQLSSSDMVRGSKTTPAFTQLAMAFHSKELLDATRWGINTLREQGATRFQPIVTGSNGGGVGSAVTRLYPLRLADPVFRRRAMIGLPESQLLTPIVMTAFPIGYARNASIQRQETKILANQYGWFRETDWLLAKGVVDRVLAIGYSNSAGAALDTPQQMGCVLGRSLFHLIHNYGYLRSRGADTDPAVSESYLGDDLPERRFASVQQLVDKHYYKENK